MFLTLAVADGETVADFDLAAIFAAHAKERPDDSVLVGIPSQGVVEDREKCLEAVSVSKLANVREETAGGTDLRVDKDAQRAGRGMDGRDIHDGQRAGEMDVGVLVGHDIGGGSSAW